MSSPFHTALNYFVHYNDVLMIVFTDVPSGHKDLWQVEPEVCSPHWLGVDVYGEHLPEEGMGGG